MSFIIKSECTIRKNLDDLSCIEYNSKCRLCLKSKLDLFSVENNTNFINILFILTSVQVCSLQCNLFGRVERVIVSNGFFFKKII